jgi:hypothetical protein
VAPPREAPTDQRRAGGTAITFEESALQSIDELVRIHLGSDAYQEFAEIQQATISLCTALYGPDSPQVKSVSAAREAPSGGYQDVAAVLACAALEDALKRYAGVNGLELGDKSMTEVVHALKSNGLIRGPQAGLLQVFVTLRDKVFHAEWASIGIPEVDRVIGFTQDFLLTRLPSTVGDGARRSLGGGRWEAHAPSSEPSG